MPKPKVENVNVRFLVQASFSLTLGMYGGPITKKCIADYLDNLIEVGGGIHDFIDSWTIEEVSIEDTLAQAEQPK